MSLVAKELGERLVDIGLLNPSDWDVVQGEYGKTLEPISNILARLGLLTEAQLKDTLELQYGVPFCGLSKYVPDASLEKLVPLELLKRTRAVPISRRGDVVLMAMVKPNDRLAVKQLKESLPDCEIRLLVCME